MSDPALWYWFAGLFALAGLLNLVRGLRRTDARRPVSLAMGVAGFLWCATAALFRFSSVPWAAYVTGGCAVAAMLIASLLGLRDRRE
jgi:hypothetical protein